MRILIIGGNGYLGWQLYQFLKRKYECTCINRVGNDYNYKQLSEKVKKSNTIIFLAGPPYNKINKNNVFARLKILKKISKLIVKKKLLIYFSTISKYSKNKDKKYYITSHRLAEEYLKKNINKNNFKIIKLCNIFGLNFLPKKKNIETSPINLFINMMIKNKLFKLKTPHAKRNWLPIFSFLELNKKIIQKKKVYKLNIKKLTISQFVKRISFLKNKTNSDNIFDKEILKTFKILKKYNS